jgi:hypothetical protein
MKKLVFAIAAVSLLILAVPFIFPPPESARVGGPDENLPWQIEALADGGSRVFGLTLGVSSLGEAQARFGDLQIAVIAAPNEPGSLEAFVDGVTLGFVTGKLILTAAAAPETITQMRERAAKTEYMESAAAAKKCSLAAADEELAHRLPIAAIAFIPSVSLDEQMVVQRFGQPAERIRSSETTEHFLYSDKGLDLRLDAKGKEILQYVAPRDFARVREPLLAAKPTQ